MSAFVVNKVHIDTLLTAGLWWGRSSPLRWFDAPMPEDAYQEGEPWGPAYLGWLNEHRQILTRETAGRVGAMLAENRRSVDHRYAEEEWEEPYLFAELPGVPVAATVVRAIDCYEYQSCEHPGWKTSEARAFCEVLRATAVHLLTKHDPTWEIRDPRVFVSRVGV